MARAKFLELTPEIHEYVVEHTRRDDALRAVEDKTEAMGEIAVMQSAPDQVGLMTLLVKAIGARRAIEVGTFTGYGAIAIARGLPDDGELVCCEVSEEYAAIARENLEAAGVADRVEIRIGPATETLASLDGEFDFAYIDADKTGYDAYYEACLALIRPGGLIMLDNMLRDGTVLEPAGDESAEALAALNDKLLTDDRVEISLLSISDGVTLALKR